MAKIETPQAPKFLSLDAKLKWVEVWRLLDRDWLDPLIHADSVAVYCQAYAQWKEAIEKIESMGTLVDRNNAVVANPYVAIRDDAAATVLKIGEDLGLRPGKALPTVTNWDDASAVVGGLEDDDDE